MKKLGYCFIFVLLLIGTVFIGTNRVFAAGSATIGFDGPSTASIGDEITVYLYVSNINNVPDGVSTVGGNISFDSSYLQYVSGEGATTPITFSIYTSNNYKIAGIPNGNYITAKTNIFTFKFKVLKQGSTTLSFKNPLVGDGNGDAVTANLSSKTITLGASQPAKSNDATLKSLGVTGQTLSPSFSANTTSYTVNVPNDTKSVTLTGTANHSGAKVTGLGSVNLTGDTTTANVKVTAEDGSTTKTYTVKIVREADPVSKSNDATLKGLSISGYNITPTFNPSTTEYQLTIPNNATEVIVNATKNNSNAKVEVNGARNLAVGNNKVTVKVTAEDGTVKNYVIHVTRQEPINENLNGDATLKSLNVSGFTLLPTFKKETTSYTINVPNNITGLNVSAIPTHDKAKVTVTGNLGWKEGVNTISIKVTAENGTTKIYTVNAIRAAANPNPGTTTGKSDDATLKSLTIVSPHTIDKTFNKDETSYSVVVPYEIEKLDFSYVTNNSKAKVTVTGNENFKVGESNTIIITVTAENGAINYYVLNVTRNSESSGTTLDKIDINNGDISPKFDPNTLEYEVKVDGDTDELDISTVAHDKDSKVEIIGNKNLKEGHNTVLIKVTDKNGMIKYYELDVIKDAPSKASSGTKFLGLTPVGWGVLFGILLFLFLLILLLILLFRKKDKEEKHPTQPQTPVGPVIDFKPEFNFGSRNGTDDDIVYPGGSLNQGSQIGTKEEPKKLIDAEEASYYTEDYENEDSIFDETITKDELISAIKEGMETKNSDKLKMLLKQDELNQLKKKIRREEEEKKARSDRYED